MGRHKVALHKRGEGGLGFNKTANYLIAANEGASKRVLGLGSRMNAHAGVTLDIEDFRNHKVEVVGKITQYNSEMELILSSGDSLRIVT